MDYFKKIVPGSWAHQKKVEYPKGANCGSPFRDKRLKKAIIAGNAQECSDILESYKVRCRPTSVEFEEKAEKIYKKTLKPRKPLKLPEWYPIVPGIFLTTTALSMGYLIVSPWLPNNPAKRDLDKLFLVVAIPSFLMIFPTGGLLFFAGIEGVHDAPTSKSMAKDLRQKITIYKAFQEKNNQ